MRRENLPLKLSSSTGELYLGAFGAGWKGVGEDFTKLLTRS
jgi:hypothetical protein